MKFIKPIIKKIEEDKQIIYKYIGGFPVGPPPEYEKNTHIILDVKSED